ncbi:MAG: glutaredoxin family protein [Deltaproteobacteria bacterium]|nr:glutaredoxin family protein [Deltaproteobacteria bacterium]
MYRERKLYTSSTDPYCRFIKQYLDENGVDYKEVDISRNAAEFYELLNFYEKGPLPVVVEDGKVIPIANILQTVNATFSGYAARY